jgi:hypothetical protein
VLKDNTNEGKQNKKKFHGSENSQPIKEFLAFTWNLEVPHMAFIWWHFRLSSLVTL